MLAPGFWPLVSLAFLGLPWHSSDLCLCYLMAIAPLRVCVIPWCSSVRPCFCVPFLTKMPAMH